MTTRKSIVSWLWKIPLCGVVHTLGAMIGGILVAALALEMPQVPGATDQTVQALLMLPGGIAFAFGLAAMATGLIGRWWERWAVLGTFLFVVNGVGNAIESSIFTTLGGSVGAAVVNLPGSFLCALAVALLIPGPSEASLTTRLGDFFSRWGLAPLASRFGLAILAFPVIYFLFGMMIAPIVTPHYADLDFLTIPPMTTLIPVLLLRSALLLLVSLPMIIGWDGSRPMLILGLGLGHFTAVGLGGLIQVTFFPAILRWTHGIEILADSMVYAWVLALLFVPRTSELEEPQPIADGQIAASPAAK